MNEMSSIRVPLPLSSASTLASVGAPYEPYRPVTLQMAERKKSFFKEARSPFAVAICTKAPSPPSDAMVSTS